MKKVLGLCMISFCLFTACNHKNPENQKETGTAENGTEEPAKERWDDFVKVPFADISDDLFMIHEKWMLVSAGNDSLYNTMTASWGGFGVGWEKPLAFMFIRDSRYTYEFLKRDTIYTLTFFDRKYKDTMQMLGSKSGRDTEKIKDSGLTYLKMPSGAPSFREASMIIECRKLINQPLQKEHIDSEEVAKWYANEPGTHHIFFGEIINVWKK